MTRRDLAPLAFLGCCAIWGTTFLVIKESNAALPPLWGAALRLGLAAILMCVPWAIARTPMPRGRVLGMVVLFGVLDYGVNLGLLYWGERDISSGLSAVFYATVPIATLLIAWAFGQEKLDGWKLAATLVAFAGVAIEFSSELFAHASALAMLAVLGAALSAAVSTIVIRAIPPQPVVPTVALGCGASAILLAATSLLLREPIAWPSTGAQWWPVLYLAVLGSIGAFGLFTWLLNQRPASSATLVGVIVPVVAVAVGAIVGGERLAGSTLAGGVLVLGGVTAALLRARATEKREKAEAASA